MRGAVHPPEEPRNDSRHQGHCQRLRRAGRRHGNAERVLHDEDSAPYLHANYGDSPSKDPYIIHAARVDAHFGFPITTLLCPALNYARYLLKGGVIRRAIAKSIIAAHLDATIHDEHERTRKRIIKSINTRNTDGLDITGPRSPECRDQVFAVVVF